MDKITKLALLLLLPVVQADEAASGVLLRGGVLPSVPGVPGAPGGDVVESEAPASIVVGDLFDDSPATEGSDKLVQIKTASSASQKPLLWTMRDNNNRVVLPFKIMAEFSSDAERTIRAAIKDLEDASNGLFKFVEYSSSYGNYYIDIVDWEQQSCASYLGRRRTGEPNTLSLSSTDNCPDDKSTVLHHLLHTLGFHHEQARADRDSYVNVLWDNIPPWKKSEYRKAVGTHDFVGMPYDFGSLLQPARDLDGRMASTCLTTTSNRARRIQSKSTGLCLAMVAPYPRLSSPNAVKRIVAVPCSSDSSQRFIIKGVPGSRNGDVQPVPGAENVAVIITADNDPSLCLTVYMRDARFQWNLVGAEMQRCKRSAGAEEGTYAQQRFVLHGDGWGTTKLNWFADPRQCLQWSTTGVQVYNRCFSSNTMHDEWDLSTEIGSTRSSSQVPYKCNKLKVGSDPVFRDAIVPKVPGVSSLGSSTLSTADKQKLQILYRCPPINGVPRSWSNFCSEDCKCGNGEGACSNDNQCTGSLKCNSQTSRCSNSIGGNPPPPVPPPTPSSISDCLVEMNNDGKCKTANNEKPYRVACSANRHCSKEDCLQFCLDSNRCASVEYWEDAGDKTGKCRLFDDKAKRVKGNNGVLCFKKRNSC